MFFLYDTDQDPDAVLAMFDTQREAAKAARALRAYEIWSTCVDPDDGLPVADQRVQFCCPDDNEPVPSDTPCLGEPWWSQP